MLDIICRKGCMFPPIIGRIVVFKYTPVQQFAFYAGPYNTPR